MDTDSGLLWSNGLPDRLLHEPSRKRQVNSRIPTYNEGSVPKKQELEQDFTVRGSAYWTTGPLDTGLARSPLRHSIILVIK